MRLAVVHLHFPPFFYLFFFLLRSTPSHGMLSISGFHALYTRPITTLTVKFPLKLHYSVGPMHYSRDPQASFFNKIFIKNGSHGTIHTFKNYFATMFSIFSFQQSKRYPNEPLMWFMLLCNLNEVPNSFFLVCYLFHGFSPLWFSNDHFLLVQA